MESSAAGEARWTVARLIDWTRGHFEHCGLESARLCAEILLAHTLGCERIRLYTRFDEVPDEAVLTAFRDAVRRAAAGEPIAYLVGVKEFFSLPIRVTPDVLIPRPETEVLVERTIDLVRRSAGKLKHIVDLGTGSGCIAISLARHLPGVNIYASDASPAALAVARDNAARLGLSERIEFREGEWLDAWRDGANRFDVIVSNPPYIATSQADRLPASVRDHEPHVALFSGDDGLEAVRAIVSAAPQRLSAGGFLLLEVAFDQAGAVRELFDQQRWESVVTHRDGLGHERVLQARLRAAEQTQVA